jgi:hypothetical protein
MNEYILVKFGEIREVVIDGIASGYNTGDVIELEPGTHTISLAGPANFTPTEQDVAPSGTSPIQTLIINFTLV